MNSTQKIWEEEYTTRRLMSGTKTIKAVVKWAKWMSKRSSTSVPTRLSVKSDFWNSKRVLDLGSGEGKNAIYFAGLGARVECIEIARNAIEAMHRNVDFRSVGDRISVHHGSIGEPYNFKDGFFDVIIDITSSNSLNEAERRVYLEECNRVLKSGGFMLVRALCKDGDTNAKKLLENSPGEEYDTYVMPEWGQTERVFSEVDIRALYGQYFDIQKLEKETHYSTFAGRTFRRNFWVMYLQYKNKA